MTEKSLFIWRHLYATLRITVKSMQKKKQKKKKIISDRDFNDNCGKILLDLNHFKSNLAPLQCACR